LLRCSLFEARQSLPRKCMMTCTASKQVNLASLFSCSFLANTLSIFLSVGWWGEKQLRVQYVHLSLCLCFPHKDATKDLHHIPSLRLVGWLHRQALLPYSRTTPLPANFDLTPQIITFFFPFLLHNEHITQRRRTSDLQRMTDRGKNAVLSSLPTLDRR
jgi:hypothetical protein